MHQKDCVYAVPDCALHLAPVSWTLPRTVSSAHIKWVMALVLLSQGLELKLNDAHAMRPIIQLTEDTRDDPVHTCLSGAIKKKAIIIILVTYFYYNCLYLYANPSTVLLWYIKLHALLRYDVTFPHTLTIFTWRKHCIELDQWRPKHHRDLRLPHCNAWKPPSWKTRNSME